MDAAAYRRFNDRLDKPLWVETCAEKNIGWVLDVFLDSLIDLLPGLQLAQGQNVEHILQKILQNKKAKLTLNYRGIGASRISIEMSDGQTIPTLQSLSAGQSQLFHLFTTIIRYGERLYINRSIRLRDITGLVVIDEIDTNLHSTLQHDVLPELIKLFPKVQFIVSSHSPLFLLGMKKTFEPDRFAIIKLPEGNPISCERFSEFEKAFEFFQSTERFEKEIEQLIDDALKPTILTEGKLDVQYIKTALILLNKLNS